MILVWFGFEVPSACRNNVGTSNPRHRARIVTGRLRRLQMVFQDTGKFGDRVAPEAAIGRRPNSGRYCAPSPPLLESLMLWIAAEIDAVLRGRSSREGREEGFVVVSTANVNPITRRPDASSIALQALCFAQRSRLEARQPPRAEE